MSHSHLSRPDFPSFSTGSSTWEFKKHQWICWTRIAVKQALCESVYDSNSGILRYEKFCERNVYSWNSEQLWTIPRCQTSVHCVELIWKALSRFKFGAWYTELAQNIWNYFSYVHLLQLSNVLTSRYVWRTRVFKTQFDLLRENWWHTYKQWKLHNPYSGIRLDLESFFFRG